MYNKERKTKYAIRKLAVATVSLAIGSVVAVPAIVDSGQVAHAEEQGVVAKKYKVEYRINNANYQDKSDIPAGLKALMPTDTKEYAEGETIRATAPTQTTYVDSENDGVWTFKSYAQEEEVANDSRAQGSNRDTIAFYAVWEFKANTEYEESYEFLSGTPTRELPYEINYFKPQKLNKYGKGAKVNPQDAQGYIYEVQDGFWVFSGWDQVEPKGTYSRHRVSGDLTGENYVLFKNEDDIKFTGHWYFYAKDEIKGDKSKQLIFRRQFVTTKTDEYELPQEIIDLYTPMKLFRGDLDEITGVDKRDTIETPLGRWLKSGVGTSYGTLFDYSKGIGSSEGYNTYYQIVAEDYVWYFYPNIPSYTFVSGTSGVPLPTDIADAKPSGIILNDVRREYGINSDYKKGDVVKPLQPGESYNYIPATPKNIIYDRENKGLWRFQGYDKDSGIVGKDVLNFKGTWTFTPTKNPTITKVDNPAQLTQAEKDKVEKAVRDANPTFPAGTRMEVQANGDVEIIYPNQSPEKSIDTIPGTSTVAEKETSAKPTVDKVDTDDTKITGTGVAGSKIVVTLPNGDTKTTTVKPDGTWEVDLDNPLAKDGVVKVTQEETDKKVSPEAPTTVVPTTAEATTPNNPAVTKVDNPAQLTQDEKDKVVDEVKKANPSLPAGTTVTVDNNGDVTITYPDKSKDTIPGASTVAEKETSAKPTVDKVDTDDLKVTGTGVAGSKIVVTLPNGDTKTTTVKPDGTWEVPLDNPLPKDSVVKVTQEETDKKVSPIAPTTVVPTTAEATTPNNPAVTKVDNPAQLTQDEKDKVVDEVKKANPSLPAGTTVTVDNNGDVTITYPDKSKDTIPGASTVAEKETSAKPTVDKVDTDDLKVTGTGVAGSKIVVTLPNGDTKTTTVKPDGTWEVPLDNPLPKDSVVKVTQEETDKKVSPIAPTTVVPTTAEATTPNNPAVTKVDNPAQLTQDEKDKVVDEVKKANPSLPAGTTVTVDNNGDVTITYPDKSKDTIPGINTVVKKGHTPAPVVDKVDTDDTKITGEGVVGATVEVELPDGTKKTTVVKPDGKWEVPLDNPLPKDSVVKVTQTAPGKKVSEKVPAKVVETIADKTTPNVPAVTEVENKTQLTQEEKGKVEKAVKDANPTFPAGTTVTVDNNGDVTITYPDKSKDTIPGTSTVVEKATTPKIADTTTPKLPEVTEVEDPTQLTQDEKDKVVDKVKKANPELPVGTTVTVGNNGDVTITYPDNSKDTIPGINTVVKKGHTPAPVVDKVDTDDTKITGEGVVGATVEVELPDGTKKTTVVKPDGKWEVPLANPLPKGSVVKATQTAPGKKVSEKVPTTVVSIADKTTPNNPAVTEVENKTKLTQGEKDKVVDEVKKANPGLPAGTTITVADNGDVTITYPDNSIDIIPGTKTVTEKTKVPGPAPKPTPQPQPGQKTIAEQITPKTPEVTEVGNKTKLTQGEKGKVEEAVKKANPGLPAGTKITVADNGEVTITYPDGSVDTISGESTVKEKVKPAGEKAKALPNTGLTANNAVVAGLSILAVAALLAARRKNNK